MRTLAVATLTALIGCSSESDIVYQNDAPSSSSMPSGSDNEGEFFMICSPPSPEEICPDTSDNESIIMDPECEEIVNYTNDSFEDAVSSSFDVSLADIIGGIDATIVTYYFVDNNGSDSETKEEAVINIVPLKNYNKDEEFAENVNDWTKEIISEALAGNAYFPFDSIRCSAWTSADDFEDLAYLAGFSYGNSDDRMYVGGRVHLPEDVKSKTVTIKTDSDNIDYSGMDFDSYNVERTTISHIEERNDYLMGMGRALIENGKILKEYGDDDLYTATSVFVYEGAKSTP